MEDLKQVIIKDWIETGEGNLPIPFEPITITSLTLEDLDFEEIYCEKIKDYILHRFKRRELIVELYFDYSYGHSYLTKHER